MTFNTEQLMAWITRIEARRERLSLFEMLELTPEATFLDLRAAFHRLATAAHPDQHRNTLGPIEMERLIKAYSLVTLAYATLRDPEQRARYQRDLDARPRTPSASPSTETVPASDPVSDPASGPDDGTRTPPARGKPLTSPPGARPGIAHGPMRPRTVSVPGFGKASLGGRGPRLTATQSVARPRGDSYPAPMGPGAGKTPNPAAPPSASPPKPRTTAQTVVTIPPADDRPKPATRPGEGRAAAPAARAQIYFRKAESAWRQGDLGAAMFNLRLAIAADPTSPTLRAALAEVEAEMSGNKK